MSITPEPGSILPRDDERDKNAYRRPAPPPPPPPGPAGAPAQNYPYAAPPPAPLAPPPPQAAAYPPPPPYAADYPPPPPPQYAPPAPAYAPPPPPQYAPASTAYAYAPPAVPEESEGISNAKWFGPVVIVALVLITAGLIFVTRDLNNTQHAMQVQLSELKDRQETLIRELEGVNAKSTQLKEELSSTASTLGKRLGSTEAKIGETKKDFQQNIQQTAQQLSAEQKAAKEQLGQQISTVQADTAAKTSAISSEVGGVKTDLGSTKKDLDATKQQLKTAMGDLGVQSGLIARNHDDLVTLQRRNERNYYEFNLIKAKTFTKVGDISIRLLKADPKKGRYTMEVNADDKVVEKKDKEANAPVQFYMARARGIPYEIVVNQVEKDKIVGYLATPK